MTLARELAIATLVAALAGCGPAPRPEDDDGGAGRIDGGSTAPDAYQGPMGTVRGTVWAPGNAPGMVPAGHEIPIAGAIVYLGLARAPAIPQQVYCDPCRDPPPGFVETDENGAFYFGPVVPQTYWLTMEKGQFRREILVTVGAEQDLELAPEQTTLPSRHIPDDGKWIPRIALAEGLWDDMEDILGKMDIGDVDAYGDFVGASAAGVYDLYWNGTAEYADHAIGDLDSLIGDLERMKQYHVIFVPCSNGSHDRLFNEPLFRDNIREYVSLGGKFYVTDWSAEWEDVVFPEFIVFESSHDTAPGGAFNPGDGSPGYESEHARAEDARLNAWLDGQQGPVVVTPGSYTDALFNADDFIVEGNWDHIAATPSILIGDNEGMPVYEQARAWVTGDWETDDAPLHPLTVTFEPTGCGRVLYSTYHTADYSHVGLLPQERVLLYLIMEIGVCKSGPIVE